MLIFTLHLFLYFCCDLFVPGNDSLFGYGQSQRNSIASNRYSLNSSPIPTIGEADRFDSPATVPRPRSAASSGFGSTKSAVINGSDLTSVLYLCNLMLWLSDLVSFLIYST